MSSFCCCCPCGDELEEYARPSNPIYRHCLWLRFCFYQLFSGYNVMFHRLETQPIPVQGAISLSSTTSSTRLPDNSMNDAHVTVSRPVPYDAEQRYTRSQRDGVVSRRDKSQTHFQEDLPSLERSFSNSGMQSFGVGKKWSGVDSEEDCKGGHPESSETALSTKLAYGLTYVQTSSQDEDVCPTCLDEYTPENPKITTHCSHDFHLGCIYEWLERSESCPICGKEMEFSESP